MIKWIHKLTVFSVFDATVPQRAWAQCGGSTSGMTTLDPPRTGTSNKWRYLRWAPTVCECAVSPCSHFPIWQSRGLVCVQVSRGHVEGRAWLFIGQCWLAAHKGDGQVERMLRVCTKGIGFAKVELSHTHLETLSYKANASFNLFSHVTLGLNLCACRCCVSSYATTWPTTTSGYRCTAAPALTPSHTPKDLAWACCCCWGTLVSTQPSYHKWMIR